MKEKTMRALSRLFLFTSICLCASIVIAAQTRGITPEDYYSFESISDPQISPDGKLVAYVVTKVERAQNRRSSSIWMAATDGSRVAWQFTTAPQNSTAPRWSPDGEWLALLSSRPGESNTPAPIASPTPSGGPAPAGALASEPPRNQIYLLSMNGGEAKRITNLKNGVSVFRWSPDGTPSVICFALADFTSTTQRCVRRSSNQPVSLNL